MASDNPTISARFEREILVLSRLSHPNIIKYFGSGKDGKSLFYAMEIVEGASLAKVLSDSGPLTWREAMNVGVQICSALQHAHNHGVIHRDLKPGNIYMSRDGEAILGDFGIALDTQANTLTHSGLTVGTYAYMSPEQITNEDVVDGKADLYAFGCLMFQTLAGRTPFIASSFPQLFEQHLNDSPPKIRSLVEDCPEGVELLLDDLLSKDPDNRPFNARQVQGRMMSLLEGETATSSLTQETSDDVPADFALVEGQAALVARMKGVKSETAPEFSWPLAVGVGAIVILVIAVAVYFGV